MSARRRFARGRLHLHHPKGVRPAIPVLARAHVSRVHAKVGCKIGVCSILLVTITYFLIEDKAKFLIEDETKL